MLAVCFYLLKSEARVSVEHSAYHTAEYLKEKRAYKRNFRRDVQSFSVRLHASPYGVFYQRYGFLARNISYHLLIDSRPREDHPFGMYLFLGEKPIIFFAQFVAKLYRVIDKSIGLLLAELFSQLAKEIREAAELFIISFADNNSVLLRVFKLISYYTIDPPGAATVPY